jgi:AraC-like DNA-binding protein
MIAGCIDRMSRKDCGGCERRDACAFIWTDLLGFGTRERRPRRENRPAGSAGNPFLAFLGEVAKAVERGSKPRGGPFSREVERHIEPLLASGPIRVEQVARELGYSRQTLYRRLKEEGVTFERLLDGLRRRLAMRLVGEQGLPVKEAAWRLGFSDPAAFSRAFKRWTGTSPRKMRPARRPAPGQSG